MRLSAYKKAIDEAKKLPDYLPEFKQYFSDNYNPSDKAVHYIIGKARLDDALFPSEFVEFYKYCLNEN